MALRISLLGPQIHTAAPSHIQLVVPGVLDLYLVTSWTCFPRSYHRTRDEG